MQIIQSNMNCMLDLETMGTGSNAVITEIGAVLFDEIGIKSKFHALIDIDSCLAKGLEVDGSTIKWWLDQQTKPDALTFAEDRLSLQRTLGNFTAWLTKQVPDLDNLHMWGNGSDFDQPKLANAISKYPYPLPWKFRNNRCYRTVKNQFRDIKLERIGKHHNGVDDAQSQAVHLIHIHNRAVAMQDVWQNTQKLVDNLEKF